MKSSHQLLIMNKMSDLMRYCVEILYLDQDRIVVVVEKK